MAQELPLKRGVNGTGGVIQHNCNSTIAELQYKWNVWETQTMVLLSFMLQLFLLATGSICRRNISGVLLALIWLAYVGADLVAVYALGLFSQYEDKYKLGITESFGNTLPFLWVPFLLVHLGGQDSITAFSLEDNNLWQRHLLNLGTQGSLALYVFWKSFHRIHRTILVPAMLVYVSGIIKYGERVWALKGASRNGLGELVKFSSPPGNNNMNEMYVYPCKESYALQTVLLARGLFVGRTVLQLGDTIWARLVDTFLRSYGQGEDKVKMVVMELGMMFDLLYTKANVLHRRNGILFRCASVALMIAAFFLFLIREKGAHNKVNVAITYTLFTGAIFMEVCSVVVVMASPWTRANFNESCCLHGLRNFAVSIFEPIHCNKWHRTSSSTSIGQFNFMDYCINKNSKPRMSKAISAIGLDKQWRNLWYVDHNDVAASYREGIVNGVLEIFSRPPLQWFGPQCFGRKLNYTLSLPFEHAIYRLHIYTDLHISRHFAQTDIDANPAPDDVTIIKRLQEECVTLSNYMMYLMVVHPSMLPVSMAAEDLEPALLKWVTSNHRVDGGARTKLQILELYTNSVLGNERDSGPPFEPEPNHPLQRAQSLKEIKEMWLRLLMYAAGKCRGELHARQLGEGGELITFVWLLMVHHGLGDVARELGLLTSNDPYVAQPGSTVSVENSNWIAQQQGPRYAFEFGGHQQAATARWAYSSTIWESEQDDDAETSGEAGRDDDDNAATPSEIDEQEL